MDSLGIIDWLGIADSPGSSDGDGLALLWHAASASVVRAIINVMSSLRIWDTSSTEDRFGRISPANAEWPRSRRRPKIADQGPQAPYQWG